MSYTQLTQDERYHIQHHYRRQTITQIAQTPDRQCKQKKRSPYKMTGQLIGHINTLVCQKLSPQQICGYLEKHHQTKLYHSTVYRYLHQNRNNGRTLWQHLRICSKPYRKKYGGKTWVKGKVPDRVGIEHRPETVNKRMRIGDWEADTIIGKDQKSALLTLVERVTCYTIICKLKNFKAEDTANAVIRVLKAHKDRVHTITMDNGKEFYRHKKIADGLKAETYFCRPYRSWEKGTNENTNGLIRQYFPKQTDFRKISGKEIRQVQDELNHRPRKTLGYETPSVLFLNIFQPLLTDVALENRK
ncbi:IS30 family transposase [Neisseria lisongii]|uniref:IS30 family transposase n=1 Tax=Neisseria lisongii TaxID=2912188 RepID=A0ABY7RLC2_9NEIS|nr:IS30 family transposase [Neisseria lisongii]WCL72424.1 IS30 family transposase [Neisseria lisongii]